MMKPCKPRMTAATTLRWSRRCVLDQHNAVQEAAWPGVLLMLHPKMTWCSSKCMSLVPSLEPSVRYSRTWMCGHSALVVGAQDTPTSSIKIRSTNVTSNVAISDGGGIHAVNMNLGEFTNVRFENNVAGTGACLAC